MGPRRLLAFRASAALLLLGASIHVGSLLPRVLQMADTLPARAWLFLTLFALCAVTALGACALGLLLLWKASHALDGRALALFLAFLAIFWGSLFRFLNIRAENGQLSINLSYGSDWASESARAALVLAVASFVRFSALFPRPLTPDRLPPPRRMRWPRRIREATLRGWWVWGMAIGILLVTEYLPGLLATVLGVTEEMQPSDPMVVRLGALYLAMAAVVYVLVPFTAIGMGVRNLRTSYRLANPDERRRMLWVVTGFSLATWLILAALGGAFLVGALDLPEMVAVAMVVLIVLAPLLVVLGAAMGVLYAGAIDPALALRRSTLYGALGALGLIAYAGIENALSALVENWLPLPGFVAPLVAGAAVAAVLIPLQRKVRQEMARRFAVEEVASAPPSGDPRALERP